MTKLATMSKKLSGVLAHEYAPEFGWCRATATVTVESGMDIGAVLKLSAGKYVWVQQSDVASIGSATLAVLIEGGAGKDVPSLAAGDHSLTILVKGPSAVVDTGLLYKNALSGAEKTSVQDRLAALDIAVRKGVGSA